VGLVGLTGRAKQHREDPAELEIMAVVGPGVLLAARPLVLLEQERPIRLVAAVLVEAPAELRLMAVLAAHPAGEAVVRKAAAHRVVVVPEDK